MEVVLDVKYNPNLTMDYIINNLDKNWNWNCVSQNHNLTIKMVDNYPNKPWNWYLDIQKS